MATASSLPLTARNALLRTIVLGGTLIFIIQFIHQWIVATLIQGAGLGFAPLPGDAEALLRSVAQGDALFGRNPVEGIRALARSYGSLTRSLPYALAGFADADSFGGCAGPNCWGIHSPFHQISTALR